MSAAVAILAYRYLGNKLRTADVFAIVTTFQSMRLPLIMAPLGMAALENVSVSLARLRMFLLRSDHFFLASESCDNNLKVPKTDTEVINSTLATDVGKRLGDINNTEEVPCDSRNPKVSLETSNVVLHLDDATFSWNDSTKSHDIPSGRVSGVNMQIERGTLTAIVGPVGGGKSTLVHGLVGELAPTAGSVDRYVSKTETGWVGSTCKRDHNRRLFFTFLSLGTPLSARSFFPVPFERISSLGDHYWRIAWRLS